MQLRIRKELRAKGLQFGVYVMVIALAHSSQVLAQVHKDSFVDALPSNYEAQELPVFETAATTPAEARQLLESALASFGRSDSLNDRDKESLRSLEQSGEFFWEGALRSDPNIEYVVDTNVGRIEIRSDQTHPLPEDDTDQEVGSTETATKIAREIIEGLDQTSVVESSQFDLDSVMVTEEITGFGVMGQPLDRGTEVVTKYLITAKRQLNGVPVVGSFIQVGVASNGAISDLVIANRQIKGGQEGGRTVAAGDVLSVAIDVSPRQAQEQLRERMELSEDSWMRVERWGLVYFDSGQANQKFYQPTYVFLTVPLTQTQSGTIAGRKLVRVVPASSQIIENISFDPIESSRKPIPKSDERPAD